MCMRLLRVEYRGKPVHPFTIRKEFIREILLEPVWAENERMWEEEMSSKLRKFGGNQRDPR